MLEVLFATPTRLIKLHAFEGCPLVLPGKQKTPVAHIGGGRCSRKLAPKAEAQQSSPLPETASRVKAVLVSNQAGEPAQQLTRSTAYPRPLRPAGKQKISLKPRRARREETVQRAHDPSGNQRPNVGSNLGRSARRIARASPPAGSPAARTVAGREWQGTHLDVNPAQRQGRGRGANARAAKGQSTCRRGSKPEQGGLGHRATASRAGAIAPANLAPSVSLMV